MCNTLNIVNIDHTFYNVFFEIFTFSESKNKRLSILKNRYLYKIYIKKNVFKFSKHVKLRE